MTPTEAPATGARWEALLDTPEIRGAPALRASLEALVQSSKLRGVDKAGFPQFRVYDARSDRTVTWGVTGLRPNGLTGWFETASREDPVGSKPGSWRIAFDGRMHRGLPWMRALAAETLTAPRAPRAPTTATAEQMPVAEQVARNLIKVILESPDAPPALYVAAQHARLVLAGPSTPLKS